LLVKNTNSQHIGIQQLATRGLFCSFFLASPASADKRMSMETNEQKHLGIESVAEGMESRIFKTRSQANRKTRKRGKPSEKPSRYGIVQPRPVFLDEGRLAGFDGVSRKIELMNDNEQNLRNEIETISSELQIELAEAIKREPLWTKQAAIWTSKGAILSAKISMLADIISVRSERSGRRIVNLTVFLAILTAALLAVAAVQVGIMLKK
jgi:hypothetical protein